MALGARWAVCEQRCGNFAAIDRCRMNCFRKIATDCRGQEIAEAALVLPLMFLLLLAILWFGRALNIYSTVARAAKEGVLTASQASCGSCNNTPANDQAIADTVEKILNADHLKVSDLAAYAPPFSCQATPAPTCTTTVTATDGQSFNLQICRGVPISCGTGAAVGCGTASPPVCGTNPLLGTRVSVGYSFNFTLGLSNLPAATIPAAAQSATEN